MKNSIKHCIILLSFIILGGIGSQLLAMEPNLSITVNVSLVAADKATIVVIVDNGTPGYEYALYDKEPWEGGVKITGSKEMSNATYSFIDISKGSYYVCVTDKSGQGACKGVIVE
jgi:hypothetical protein